MDDPVPGAAQAPVDVLASTASVTAQSPTGEAQRRRSFDDFFRAEFPRLLALARALCGSATADDVAQEAMLAAYRDWPRIEGYDSPEAWVRRVCIRRATSILRTRAAEASALLRLQARPAQSESFPVEPEHEAFWAEVRRLPKRQAQAAALRYVYSMSVADVANVMSCSQGAVKSHLSRARATLSERLDLDGGDDAS
jgi:RNA polymerase sigma factor (sigma-70 family)